MDTYLELLTELDGYIYAVLFGLASLANALLMSPTYHDQMVHGHNYQVQSCSLIYKKLLRLNQKGISQLSIGKIVNIMSNDVVRYNQFSIGMEGIMAPIVFVLSIYLMYRRIQNAAFVALAALCTIAMSSIVEWKFRQFNIHTSCKISLYVFRQTTVIGVIKVCT